MRLPLPALSLLLLLCVVCCTVTPVGAQIHLANQHKPSLAGPDQNLRTSTTKKKSSVKYLQCDSQKHACDDDSDAVGEHVHICHYNADHQIYETTCVRARSNIVALSDNRDYCGACLQPVRAPQAFATKAELQDAVNLYLDYPPSHANLAAQYGYPMNAWDVSQITDFSDLFAKRVHFNEDIGDWDMSRATDLSRMFWHAHSFAGDNISRWNVTSVTTLERTFFGAEQFQADLSRWNTSSLQNLMGTFWRATRFNSPLNTWDTSKVVVMSRCFADALAFNQPLTHWDTSRVVDMSWMFQQAIAFSQDQSLTEWNIQHVRDMQGMLAKIPHFQSTAVQSRLLESWKIPAATNVDHLFTAPRPVSLRSQQLHDMGVDLATLLRLQTTPNATHPNTNIDDVEEQKQQNVQEATEEIRCQGGVCM